MKNSRPTLLDLEMHGDFIRRHIGPNEDDVESMLREITLPSLDKLIQKTMPDSIVSDRPLDLTAPRSERAATRHLRHMRHRNQVFISMIGCGYHGTVMPSVIKRNVLENPDWYLSLIHI